MEIVNTSFTIALNQKEIEKICNALVSDIQDYIYNIEDKYIKETYDSEVEFVEAILARDRYEQYELLTNLCNLIQWSGVISNMKIIVEVRYEKALAT